MFAGRTSIGTSRLLALIDSEEYPCAKMSIREARTPQESAFKPPTPDKNTLPKPIKPPKSRNNQATGRAILYQEGDFAHLHKQFQAQHRHFRPPKTKIPSRNALKPPKQAVIPKSGGRKRHGRAILHREGENVTESMGKAEKLRIRGTDRKPELITDNNPQPGNPTTRQNRSASHVRQRNTNTTRISIQTAHA